MDSVTEIHFRGTPEEVSRQWHDQRDKGIGGSDVSVIMGANRYKMIGELWREKTGRAKPEDLSHKPAVMLGNAMEPVLRDEYAYRHQDVEVIEPDYMLQTNGKPWRQASLDGVLTYADGHHEVLEIKTVGQYAAHQWDDGLVPINYALQVLHYMAVTGFKRAQLIAMIGNQRIIERTVDRDEPVIAEIEEAIDDFWIKCVEADKEPMPRKFDQGLAERIGILCYDPDNDVFGRPGYDVPPEAWAKRRRKYEENPE